MGYNVKLGKGGHGLEVYDSEGKYAEDFTFQMGENEIKGYDDFRSLYFADLETNSAGAYSASMLEQLYNSNPGFKQDIDNELYQAYNQIVTEAVNDYNAKQVWDTPEEAAKHLDELFVPNLIQNLLENEILTSDAVSVAKNYKVSILAACLQMSRYPKNRGNLITSEEYQERIRTEKAEGYLESSTNVSEYKDYIDKAIKGNKSIPILRNLGRIDASDQKNVFESFYDENSPRHSCLAHASAVNCSYLGSVIYFSAGDYSYSGGLSVHGLVKMNKNLRLLECPLPWRSSSEYECNRAIPEISRFRIAINQDGDFNSRLKNKILENSELSDNDAEIIVRKIKTKIDSDPGFCAMLMGYDAIYGCSYHFDVLNLGICDILERK